MNVILAGAESAEASVDSDSATTRDKRKRLRDNMDPPSTNSNTLTLSKLLDEEYATYKCNPNTNRRTNLSSLLQALADCGNGKGEKMCSMCRRECNKASPVTVASNYC